MRHHMNLVWRLSLGCLVFTLLSFFAFEKPVLESLSAQASIDPSSLVGDYDSQASVGRFHGQVNANSPIGSFPSKFVLGVSDKPKRIEVDLAQQRLYAFEGDTKVYEFPVSTGKWGRTPTGTFHIWGKFRYTKMSGGSKLLNTYYYLPNVPFVMFFANSEILAGRGFSLHGTYWHNNFGHPMSHGCVNMRTEDAGTIFNWTQPSVGDKTTARASSTDEGTEVVIYGTPPAE